jgi:trehalose/maltose hydrolase-like predicted phosphorylase
VVALRRSATPVDVSLGPERLRRSKAIKQADVVALSALIWEKWPAAVHDANFRYYEPRTAHGSSLSPALHALVAARLGDGNLAQAYFRQAAEIDLANNMGNAAGGIHMGALGGLWQAAVFGRAA